MAAIRSRRRAPRLCSIGYVMVGVLLKSVRNRASLGGGCDWRGEREPRRNKLGKHSPTKHLPNRSKQARDRLLTSNGIPGAASFLVELRPPRY